MRLDALTRPNAGDSDGPSPPELRSHVRAGRRRRLSAPPALWGRGHALLSSSSSLAFIIAGYRLKFKGDSTSPAKRKGKDFSCCSRRGVYRGWCQVGSWEWGVIHLCPALILPVGTDDSPHSVTFIVMLAFFLLSVVTVILALPGARARTWPVAGSKDTTPAGLGSDQVRLHRGS